MISMEKIWDARRSGAAASRSLIGLFKAPPSTTYRSMKLPIGLLLPRRIYKKKHFVTKGQEKNIGGYRTRRLIKMDWIEKYKKRVKKRKKDCRPARHPAVSSAATPLAAQTGSVRKLNKRGASQQVKPLYGSNVSGHDLVVARLSEIYTKCELFSFLMKLWIMLLVYIGLLYI